MTLLYQKLNCCVACCPCERKANFDIATYIDSRNRCYLWDLVYVGRRPCPSASLSESRPAWLLLLIRPTLASGSHTAAGISGQELIVSLNWGQGHNKYAANHMYKRAGKVFIFQKKKQKDILCTCQSTAGISRIVPQQKWLIKVGAVMLF